MITVSYRRITSIDRMSIRFLFFSFFFIVTQTHIPLQKYATSCTHCKERSEKFMVFSVLCKVVCTSQFCLHANLTYMMPRETRYFCHKGSYSSNNVLFGAAPKTESGTRMTNLLLNVQCIKRKLEDSLLDTFLLLNMS